MTYVYRYRCDYSQCLKDIRPTEAIELRVPNPQYPTCSTFEGTTYHYCNMECLRKADKEVTDSKWGGP